MSRDGEFERITLRNGARAIRHLGHGEVMHPSVGPWAEANALYVEQPRLAERLSRPGPALVIHDLGMGAAANAVAALACAAKTTDRKRALEVISFERDLAPLRLALGDPEGFPYLEGWREAAQSLMTIGRWERGGLAWRLLEGDWREHIGSAAPAELVYFDPFSPAHQADLWSPSSLAQVHARCSSEGAMLITYSAATPTRASLLLGGFFVGIGDPIGTKKETTVAATRRELLARPLERSWLDHWRRSGAKAPHGEPLTPEVERRLVEHPQF